MKKHYTIVITRSAEKALRELPEKMQIKVIGEIKRLEFDPQPYGAKKLSGLSSTYRIRVGDYRIIYEIEQNRVIITVLKIAHRREVYR
jgi:mRNA interferase RelE/StbE